MATSPSRAALVLVVLAASHAAADAPSWSAGWRLKAISRDGARALIQDAAAGTMHFRSVDLATGKTVVDADLTAVASLPPETVKGAAAVDLTDPALSRDLARSTAVLRDFPGSAGGRIAGQEAGRHVVFNVGDELRVGTGSSITAALGRGVGYSPWLTPDGSAVLFRRPRGVFPSGSLRYELFVAPLTARGAGRAKVVAGTAGIREGYAQTVGGDALRFIVSPEPETTCVVEVGLAPPYRAQTKGCLTDREHPLICLLSPHGTAAGCVTVAGEAKFRLRILDVETGRTMLDAPTPTALVAVADDGVILAYDAGEPLLLDARTGARTALPRSAVGFSSAFRSTTELVTVFDDRPVVVDLTPYRR